MAMEIFTFLKWVLKQYTLRIVLLVLVILLVQVYTDSLTPTKDYILKIINRDDQAEEIASLDSGVTAAPPAIIQAINSKASTTSPPPPPPPTTKTTTTTTTATIKSTDAPPQQPTSTLPLDSSSNHDAQPPHIKIYDLNSKLEPADIYDKIQCRKSIEVFVSTTLCVHDLFRDVHVSGAIMRDGVWERHIVVPYMDFIHANPDLLVLDVGAQIGQYSLLPAKLGHHVVTVEPFIDNIYRLHKAAQAESIQNKITLIQNAVSNKRNEVKLLQEASDNIGGQSLLENKDRVFSSKDMGTNKYLVETILFDDIIPFLPKMADGSAYKRAIMKIDIEGFEPFAFQHASKLFDLLDIPIVYMEWGQLPKQFDNKKTIVDMIDFFLNRSYSAWGNNMLLRKDEWQHWPWDIIWKKTART